MCNESDIVFVAKNLAREEVKGRRILEVGSLDINGSVRRIIGSLEPREYMGVDIVNGPGVDMVCCVENLLEQFGGKRFDVVISTELLEHVREWRKAISNIKGVCVLNGIILITTRSFGFPYHGYPYDFWRYEGDDVRNIFSDCDILSLESDPLKPGVLAKLRKPKGFIENDLSNYSLYSIVVGKRAREISDNDLETCHFRSLILRARVRAFLGRVLERLL